MAIWRRGKPDALLHHSDQGSQYTSQHFQELLAENGVTCSMSRSGNVWDKAAMESLFAASRGPSGLIPENRARQGQALPDA
jgi:putative transposase